MDRKQFIELMEYLEHKRMSSARRFRSYRPFEIEGIFQVIAEMSPGYMQHSRWELDRDVRDEDENYIMSVYRALRTSNDIAEEIGMLDLIEEYEELIISGMEIEDIPSHDIIALEQLGESNPKGALLAAYLNVKQRGKLSEKNCNELTIEQRLRSLEKKLRDAGEGGDTHSKDKKSADKPRPKRRWFKGLGKVAQGSALTLADVALAAGVLVLPVDPSTQTWGAIVSSVTGVGTALDGMGELRGE